MTLVIACKSKDGIVVASDGKARRSYPGLNRPTDTIENAQKIFEYDKCCLLPYGDGEDDYYRFLGDLTSPHKGKEVGYDFFVKHLPDYLRDKYMFPPPEAGEIGVILAGIDKDGEQQIRAFTSAKDYALCTVDQPYIHGGHLKIAYELFDKQVGTNAEMESIEIVKLAHQAIASTAEANPSRVNNNVTKRLISENGVTPIVY